MSLASATVCYVPEDAATGERLQRDLAALGVHLANIAIASRVVLVVSPAALARPEFRQLAEDAAESGRALLLFASDCPLTPLLAGSPSLDFRDAGLYGAAFFRLCVELGLQAHDAEPDRAMLQPRPHRWHCVFCGWRCDEPDTNSYQCRRCERLRPLMADSCTCIQCLLCNQLSLGVAAFCEWCGERLGVLEA